MGRLGYLDSRKRSARRQLWAVRGIIGIVVLSLLVFLLLALLKPRLPDISGWHACQVDSDCVVSTAIMCGGDYGSVHDACINKEHFEKAQKKIPVGFTCKYGVTECYCSDNTCFSKR